MTDRTHEISAELRKLLVFRPPGILESLDFVGDVLERLQFTSFMLMIGHDIPEQYSCTQAAILQTKNETILERLVISNIRNSEGATQAETAFSRSDLGSLCQRDVEFLESHGFFSLPVEVGEPHLDGSSAEVFAILGDKSRCARFFLSDGSSTIRPFRRSIKYWLTASSIRIRLDSFLSRRWMRLRLGVFGGDIGHSSAVIFTTDGERLSIPSQESCG